MEPPMVRFKSPVRHPNVDEVSGRICLDLLRMPPEGSWRPNISFTSLIVSILVLLAEPNMNDPVRPDLVSEWVSHDENANTSTENCIENCIENCTTVKTRMGSLSLNSLRKKPKIE
jgi:ubiquitin-protein ligase